MLPGAALARIDSALQPWMQQAGCHLVTSSANGQGTAISGRLFEGDSLSVIAMEATGLSQLQLQIPSGQLHLFISEFGQCKGSAGGREVGFAPKRFAFVALPHEQVKLQISSPRLATLSLQISLQRLHDECALHEIDKPQLRSLHDSIPGHEVLLLACAQQLLQLAEQPASTTRNRLQHPLEASILSLLASLVASRTTQREAPDPHEQHPQAAHVQRAMLFLESKICEPITLTMICQACNVSARTLQTAFQAVSNKTPLQVLHEMRLKQLHQLLLQKVDVRSACSQVGLQPTGRLSASYKRLFGELPRQTRRKAKG